MITRTIRLRSTGDAELDQLLEDTPLQARVAAAVLMSIAVLDEALGSRVLQRFEREFGHHFNDLPDAEDATDAKMADRWAAYYETLHLLDE